MKDTSFDRFERMNDDSDVTHVRIHVLQACENYMPMMAYATIKGQCHELMEAGGEGAG